MNNRDLLQIAKEHGTPTYVYDLRKIKKQINKLKKAFTYPRTKFLYAVKANFNLHLVCLREKFFGLFFPDIQVMVIRFEPEADSFYLGFLLLRPLLLFLFGFLVLKLSKIHDFHNRGTDIGNNLNQIQFSLAGHLKGLFRRDNANLLAAFVNKPHGRNTDIFIDSGPRSAKLRLTAKKTSANMFCVIG